MSEAKRRGTLLEKCVAKALETLQKENIVREFDHYESKYEMPDFWVLLTEFLRVEIECKNWAPKQLQREEATLDAVLKDWSPGAEKVLVYALFSRAMTLKARGQLYPCHIIVVGKRVESANDSEAIAHITYYMRQLFKAIVALRKAGLTGYTYILPWGKAAKEGW